MSAGYVLHERDGTITVSPDALTQLVVGAAERIDGARVRRPRRGLELEIEGGRASVELELAARLGVVLPELARAVQDEVAHALQEMCGLDVERVDVSIEELDD